MIYTSLLLGMVFGLHVLHLPKYSISILFEMILQFKEYVFIQIPYLIPNTMWLGFYICVQKLLGATYFRKSV